MIGIIIVNYKTDDRVIKYVTEELPKITAENKIVIVNNSATDQNDLRIAEACGGCVVRPGEAIDEKAHIFVLESKDNLGYARGNNLGAEFLLRYFRLDYLLISNCDLYFAENDVIDKLIAKMEETSDIGLIGPCVVTVARERQSPVSDIFIWKTWILPKLCFPVFIFLSRYKGLSTRIIKDVEGNCDVLNGSIFLIRTSAFMKAGMFDPNTFLYCEEPILATRIKNVGFTVYYYNKVKVVHEHQVTMKTMKTSETCTAKYNYISNRYYQKEYRNVNSFDLLMFDISHYVYTYIWAPLILILNMFRRNNNRDVPFNNG